ncbi:Zymogen granule membrane protein 16 [Nibea albiflora]|uniref:Zymogen granule membrane protein 16 n=1 Tax=Nibea albiflora TaxID=240163 RepID=A0ACB7F706_NIBAL|nr:Zymogen granule membrane protein 16 [Nibea albiflora]
MEFSNWFESPMAAFPCFFLDVFTNQNVFLADLRCALRQLSGKTIQLLYSNQYTARVGRSYGAVHQLDLFDEEVIVQISGKYHSNYIYQLIFVTSRGRSLIVGQPIQTSFNFYPIHVDAELRMLSGRTNGAGITALAAHWGAVYMYPNTTSGSK